MGKFPKPGQIEQRYSRKGILSRSAGFDHRDDCSDARPSFLVADMDPIAAFMQSFA
jgi:hypothetical protein